MRTPTLRSGKHRLRCNTEYVETALLGRFMQCLFESHLMSKEIEAIARRDAGCERLISVPGIGPIISSAMVAAIGCVYRKPYPGLLSEESAKLAR